MSEAAEIPLAGRRRGPTATSSFGVSRRENHDASDFYRRFSAPDLSTSSDVAPEPSARALDQIFVGDARSMTEVADDSVALVVTSPPYFAGKAYEEELGQGHIPATYVEYLDMLEAVFAECVRTLEPGGRIAVNVANLGRKPYRSLSADVITILQDRLRLLLRGEVIWIKARGAGGSCAWGSFQKPANPVLRDLTERVIIASKGRFDRALTAKARARDGLPHEASLFRDEFMEATTDIWEIPPESATRVGHPAPFPVELPERLIHLYTYRGDLVLDPFMGSGTTAVAALRTGRHYAGYDTDDAYASRARERVAAEHKRIRVGPAALVGTVADEAVDDAPTLAMRRGLGACDLAHALLRDAGFDIVAIDEKVGGVEISFAAVDVVGRRWLFAVSGAMTSTRTGLRKADTLWKALGQAAVVRAAEPDARLVLLSTDLPARGSAGAHALDALTGTTVDDVVELLAPDAAERLRRLADAAP